MDRLNTPPGSPIDAPKRLARAVSQRSGCNWNFNLRESAEGAAHPRGAEGRPHGLAGARGRPLGRAASHAYPRRAPALLPTLAEDPSTAPCKLRRATDQLSVRPEAGPNVEAANFHCRNGCYACQAPLDSALVGPA